MSAERPATQLDVALPAIIRSRWQTGLMVVVALCVTGWQLWSVAGRRTTPFELSYWLVTWDYGFVRRGLLGEVNRLLFPHDLMLGAQVLCTAMGLVSAGTVAVVALLCIARSRRHDAALLGLGWLLLVSPFTVKALANFARPDQLGVVVMALVALVAHLSPRRPMVPLALLGGTFAVMVFGHEAAAVGYGPWIFLLLVRFYRHERVATIAVRLAAFFAAPAVAMWLVVTRGTATNKQVRLLKEAGNPLLPSGNNMFNYMGDGISESLAEVAKFGAPNLATMAGIGLALWVVHLLALACIPGLRLRPPRHVALIVAFVVIPTFLAQISVAFDWQRWFAVWPGTGLVVLALVMLVERSASVSSTPAVWTVRRLVPFVVLSVLLTLVPVVTATNKLPCSANYILRESAIPFVAVRDAWHGTWQQFAEVKCSAKKK